MTQSNEEHKNNKVYLAGKLSFKNILSSKKGKNFTTFSLGFYNGKNEQGENNYFGINCLLFGETDFKNDDFVQIDGYITGKKFIDKNNNPRKEISIIVKNIEKSEFFEKKQKEDKNEETKTETIDDNAGNTIDDEIPF